MEQINTKWPYLKRKNGSDHIFVDVYDHYLHKLLNFPYLDNAIKIGNYGALPDYRFPEYFDIDRDIVIFPHHNVQSEERWFDMAYKRTYVSYYNGNSYAQTPCGTTSRTNLSTMQFELDQLCPSSNWLLTENRNIGMSESHFAWAPSGHDCWSFRLIDAILHGAVPVVAADKTVFPFERFFNWNEIVRIVKSDNIYTRQDMEKLKIPSLWIMDEMRLYVTHFERVRRSDGQTETTPLGHLKEKVKRTAAWFSFDTDKEKNFWKLLFVELWCKTDKANLSPKELRSRVCEGQVRTDPVQPSMGNLIL
eukprot:TRINITY_DN2081_c0_g1_i2.p1 TRINITY_DN2081_c0_g1~~TRINITY_DN2081_c0_g1_i2.p1  ORF type:complete len:306 (-),score=61.76 TRINITY_DN2081_c0_g1_i2:1090-2007(-)